MHDSAIRATDDFIEQSAIDTSVAGWKQQLAAPPTQPFDPESRVLWKLETNCGTVVIELRPDVAPVHVSSTLYLTRLGFYDGLRFHRVIPGFMAQGGCPIGSGTGGPGYQYDSEFDPDLRHDRPGLLSMANAGPGTDGSQFFLTFVPTPWLDDHHTLFGAVTDGMDALAALEAHGSPAGRPRKPLEIQRATIEVVPRE